MFGLKTNKTAITPFHRIWEASLDDHIIDLQWSPMGRKLAAASVSGEIKIFSDDGVAELTLPGHSFGATVIALEYGWSTFCQCRAGR